MDAPYYQQQAEAITWIYTSWMTNAGRIDMLGTFAGTAQVCNNATNGTRLKGPFWYCVMSNSNQQLSAPTGRDAASGYPYLDVTAQIEAGAVDGILDPGECAVVTNIAFTTGNQRLPSNLVWLLKAVSLPAVDRVDSDGDGIPDEWELGHAPVLDPVNPLDGAEDPDADGMSNEKEWISGTDPTNTWSYFALGNIHRPTAEAGPVVAWRSASNRIYRIFAATNAMSEYTLRLDNLRATPPMNVITDATPEVEAMGFYRIDVRNP